MWRLLRHDLEFLIFVFERLLNEHQSNAVIEGKMTKQSGGILSDSTWAEKSCGLADVISFIPFWTGHPVKQWNTVTEKQKWNTTLVAQCQMNDLETWPHEI